jgi:hypothetical protein
MRIVFFSEILAEMASAIIVGTIENGFDIIRGSSNDFLLKSIKI